MGKKCFVFDFDCTLTYTHWFYFLHDFDKYLKKYGIQPYLSEYLANLHNKGNKSNKGNNKLTSYEKQVLLSVIMGGKKRIDMLNTFLKILIRNGYSLFIASRGYLDDILYLLKLSGIKANMFKYINARSYENEVMSKDAFLCVLYRRGYTKIRYVDDTDTEHEKFITSGYCPISAPSLGGMKIDYVYYGSNIGLQKESLGLTLKMMKIILENELVKI